MHTRGKERRELLAGRMKIVSLMLLRALDSEQEATILCSAFCLDNFGYFQREPYVARPLPTSFREAQVADPKARNGVAGWGARLCT